MPEIETLGILEEIGALVSDRLQVVSYKWLSRNFLISSDSAKKLLQEFVEKHEHGFEVVYSVAGWLKKVPASYHIRLVPGPKLAEAKQEFDDNCSVQVYSVQVCIPKDPVTIWNAEFTQAEELFKQSSALDNCLRDNRFCGISNSFVKRNVEGEALSNPDPQALSSGLPGRSANLSSSLQQPQPKKLQQSSPNSALHSSNTIPPETETVKAGSRDVQSEALEKDKTSVATAKKKGHSEKNSTGTEGSLANFWGRASTKSKSNNSAQDRNHPPKTNDSADALFCAHEAIEAASSDDEESDVNFKRVANGDNGGKKRRVVLDDSDEDDHENAVNLGSPDPPNGQSFQCMKQKNQTVDIEKKTLDFDELKDHKGTKVKEEKTAHVEVKHPVKKDSSVGKNPSVPVSKGIIHEPTDGVDTSNKQKGPHSVPGSPKRRKVLKTKIDERGREVTEVIWEGEETDWKDTNGGKKSTDSVNNPNDHKIKVEDNAAAHAVNRPATTKKSPAVGSTVSSHPAGRAGNKKGANAKDPKQGNILSFFKRV